MFEDSTFESNGTIRTRSRGWMIATFALNSTILLVMILVPLIYMQALPHQAMAFLMEVPPPPPATPPPTPRTAMRQTPGPTEMFQGQFVVPRRIPNTIVIAAGPEPDPFTGIGSLDTSPSVPGGIGDPFGRQPAPRVIHPAPVGPMRVSSGVAASVLIYKVLPNYPAIAKAAGVQGTVVLAATISKSGTIQNLRVLSGPAMLQQAALDAVSSWRYRPFLLSGQPIEAETTVNVVFTLGH